MTTTEDQATGRSPVRVRAPGPRPFGPGSILWDEAGLHLPAIAGNSAFILQAMHPAIGTAVDRLPGFRTDPVGRAVRGFTSVQTWVYGGQAAVEEGRRLRRMHRPPSAAGQDGRRHRALSPSPWAWAHLSGYYTVLTVLRYFSRTPMTLEREEQIFEEFRGLGRILRVPERMLPTTVADYWVYFDAMLAGTLVPHPVAFEVLERMDKVAPAVPVWLRPLLVPFGLTGGRFARFVAVGTLPEGARRKLGLTWTPADERKLQAVGTATARAAPLLPERLRYTPVAYRARQAARARESLEEALIRRPP
ncbi:Uncharacterized conserved protein, DUF2236 family [Thermomonospora echinospora]|uniref:Uncharacterized conserved protein, DUF2236 family n=1 Tax=Thermomonospora echinospora TaxID=1992 RepID=A0A1H5XAI8_9ACTN|nr:oxygenase MpaB family protein [Thermomonospora echinospora]SEG08759.1 Uncharacterized conserved protein, DUF2236 family [Thermomonospora echinospora]